MEEMRVEAGKRVMRFEERNVRRKDKEMHERCEDKRTTGQKKMKLESKEEFHERGSSSLRKVEWKREREKKRQKGK